MSRYSAYFAIEPKVNKATGGTKDRADLIRDFTDGKKHSLKQLRDHEYKGFIQYLKKTYNLDDTGRWQHTPENIMRRKIIGIFREMGYCLPNGKADIKAINEWCQKYSVTKQPLNENDHDELVRVVTQAEIVLNSFSKSITA